MKDKRQTYFASIIFFFLIISAIQETNAQDKKIDLSGIWQFQIDRDNIGQKEKWFTQNFQDNIYLPGSMTENRKGDDVTLHTNWTASIYDSSFFFNPRLEKFRQPDNLKLPFWLTPVKYYVGEAWYQRKVIIPKDWKGEQIQLFLERPHTETRLWVNGVEVGMQNSLSVPHIYDITKLVKVGENRIALCIDNRTKDIDVGKDSHSITDQTQGNWNGIVGGIELQAQPVTYIDDVQVFPHVGDKKALVKLHVNGMASGELRLEAESYNGDYKDVVTPVVRKIDSKTGSDINLTLSFGDKMQLWDEFHPNLYRLKVILKTGNREDVKEIRFGMREFTTKGKYFYVNGRQTFLRGTVENCTFPLTGYPPMDLDSWMRVFRICKQYGLNHMRFHSYCPPAVAFEAADLVGFYLQPEGPSWPNHGSSLGNGKPIDNYLWIEAQRIIKEYGNSPSFCMFAIGNEPRGRWVPWVSKFVDYWKSTDTRRVYTGASVGGSWAWQPESQYHVKAGARGLDWDQLPESNSDFRANIDTVKQPYISHEMGQWCVFPDFTEIPKYTGVMRARNFELFQQDLADRHMANQASAFLQASGKLQALCYKHEIEKTFRTPGYAGFQMLSLNDYSGQGTALVGLLNVFWQEKGYVNAEEFTRYCAPTVLLARMDKFVFTNDETVSARIEVANFGQNTFPQQSTDWKITDAYGTVIAKGSLTAKDIAIGNCQSLGEIKFPLKSFDHAQKLNLQVSFPNTTISNNWDLWVYPSQLPQVDTTDIYITETIDAKAQDVLKKGGKVLFLPSRNVEKERDVVQYMTPSFWNTSWFKMRPPHTEGSLINDFHPIFKNFPTDSYTGLQWWELVNRGPVMEITDFPANFQPIVQPIDTWFVNRKLASLFEANIGKGKIVVCSFDLKTDLENRPVARQLYYSILKYMNSDTFHPDDSLDLSLIQDLTRKAGEQINTHTNDAPDELKNVTN